MKELVLYIHGKGGCAGESEHYKPLFPDREVVGLDYQTFIPWETGKIIREAVIKLHANSDSIILIANSIGAFFSMNAGIDAMIRCAYFISPVVDMEKLILDNHHLHVAIEALTAKCTRTSSIHTSDINEVKVGVSLEGFAQLLNDNSFIFLSHDCNVLIKLDFVNSLGIHFDTAAHRT